MEFIVELLFEVLFQFAGEVLLEAGFEGIAKVLSNRVSRFVVGIVAAVGVGFAFGWWWGDRFAGLGHTEVPRSLFVSIAFAMLFAVLTAVSAWREYRAADPVAPVGPSERPGAFSADRWLVWRWPPGRLAGFALLNASVAIGITTGFTPEAVVLR